jgi:hypothetical protein
MNFVSALSSIASMMTGGATEGFKSLVRPRSLVAAAIFLALNVVLVLPLLARGDVKVVLQLSALPTAWQTALATLALFILAYLITSLSAFFLSLVSGRFLEKSWPLGTLCLAYQRRRFSLLHQTIREAQALKDEAVRDLVVGKAAYQLAFDFPDEAHKLAPTGLGNVLLSTATYTRKQFGAHLDTVLPLLLVTLKTSNAELEGRLRERQESLSFLSGLVVLLLVVAAELVVAHRLARAAFPSWQVLGLVLAAVPVYMAAVQTARALGQELRNALVLYLDDVGQQLGLRELPREAEQERRDRWEQINNWIVFGALELDVKDAEGRSTYARLSPRAGWYRQETVSSPLEVSAPPGVRCSTASEQGLLAVSSSPTQWMVGPGLSYRFVVDHDSTVPVDVKGCYLLVKDARVAEAPRRVQGTLTADWRTPPSATLEGKRSVGNTLWWQLGELPTRASMVLEYRVNRPELVVEVAPADTRVLSLEPPDKHSGTLRLTLQHTSVATPPPLTVTLSSPTRALEPGGIAYSVMGGARGDIQAQKMKGALRYTLPALPAGAQVEFILPYPQDSVPELSSDPLRGDHHAV